ncbi:MAG: hypothetical protein ACRC2T_03550 [Thermoguttaceae bacterium]
MYEEERSQFESNIFKFKRKKANKVASYIFAGSLGLGFFLGLVLYVVNYGMSTPHIPFLFKLRSILGYTIIGGGLFTWFRFIAFSVVGCGLLGFMAGLFVGTQMDKKKRN